PAWGSSSRRPWRTGGSPHATTTRPFPPGAGGWRRRPPLRGESGRPGPGRRPGLPVGGRRPERGGGRGPAPREPGGARRPGGAAGQRNGRQPRRESGGLLAHARPAAVELRNESRTFHPQTGLDELATVLGRRGRGSYGEAAPDDEREEHPGQDLNPE